MIENGNSHEGEILNQKVDDAIITAFQKRISNSSLNKLKRTLSSLKELSENKKLSLFSYNNLFEK